MQNRPAACPRRAHAASIAALVMPVCLFLASALKSQGASSTTCDSADCANVIITPRVRTRPQLSTTLSVDSKLVLIPVTVTDALSQPVPGLHKEAFRLFEDGVEQRITHFAIEDAPLSLGILFDSSASMTGKLDKSREAVTRLFQGSSSSDEYFVVGFNDAPALLTGFTSDTAQIEDSLAHIQPAGWTSLLDAIALAANECRKAGHERRALLIVSDGGDNRSRFTEKETRELLRECNITVYAIGIQGPMVSMRLLSSLAAETGGRLFAIHSVDELPAAMEKVNASLREQYLLGYTPIRSERDGKYRRVLVKLNSGITTPRLHASWRVGYYAPY